MEFNKLKKIYRRKYFINIHIESVSISVSTSEYAHRLYGHAVFGLCYSGVAVI